jgi:hypothetical protein
MPGKVRGIDDDVDLPFVPRFRDAGNGPSWADVQSVPKFAQTLPRRSR